MSESKKFWFLPCRWRESAVMALVVVIGAAGLWFWQLTPPAADTVVDIRAGESVTALSEQVAGLGITRSPRAFRWYWRLQGAGSLHEGRYSLKGVTTLHQLFSVLSGGTPMTAWITIPEGYTVRRIAERLEQQAGITQAAFLKAAVNSDGTTLEGHLFPDTYQFLYGGDPAEIVSRMTERFDQVLPADFARQAQKHGLTTQELLIVASIIEREARFDADRSIIASVIFNRLGKGMRLQMDATLGYVLPAHNGFYTAAELATESPYNTYVHAGLPPTPICNPGLASLTAAAHAPATAYYYFLAKSDGHCVFARTYAEHARNIHLYLSGGN